ncbi:AAA family ATPase [Streptomyces sp. N2-109]|uniref:AAA family ATPase n=1 Tax=Streptomyces gossypii TaxID=2883101 RepID=A0ABT2JXM8_9ACTN|nr:AAA family ATPase [Streptomyces gossypii]MCT2592014.1 AAA family ATPase [Streptomyces gossypii]
MVTRILPAVSDPDATRVLATLLSQLPDSEPLATATDSTQLLNTLAHAAAESVADLPEAVVVHELIGPVPALELIREIALRFPAVGVILLTRDTSPALYSAAMDAGARGVVGLPVGYDELAIRVAAAASWAMGVRRHLGAAPETFGGPGGTVLAVTGAKGGVGCTLTAVQLALAARASGRNAALIDMNLQSGDVASFLDVQFRRSVADLAGITDLTPRVLEDAVYTHDTGLALLLAPGEGERGEEVDDRAARQIVGAMRARYEVVIIDCGTQMHAANAAAVELADRAILLTTPDVLSVRAAKRMVRLWDRLQIRKAEETVTTVNRASRHTEIQPALIARIVGTPVARATIPANFKELHTALDAGRIQDLDHRSTVKQALWSLAAELGAAAPLESPKGGKDGKGSRHARQDKPGKAGKSGKSGKPSGRSAKSLKPSKPAQGIDGGTRPAALPPGGSGAGGRQWDDRGSVYLPARRPSGSRPSAGRASGSRKPGADTAGAGTTRTARPDGQPGPGALPDRLRRALRDDRGALTVEFAGMVPIIAVVLALLWQCVLIGYTFTLAGNAADEGARAATSAAAYGDPGAACESAAREHLPSAWDSAARINCYVSGNVWKADVDLATPVLFPGAANLPFTVHGSAGAALESEGD